MSTSSVFPWLYRDSRMSARAPAVSREVRQGMPSWTQRWFNRMKSRMYSGSVDPVRMT